MTKSSLVRPLMKLLFACALVLWSFNTAEASHCAAYDFNPSGCQSQGHCYYSPGYCDGWGDDCFGRSEWNCRGSAGCYWTPGMCLEW